MSASNGISDPAISSPVASLTVIGPTTTSTDLILPTTIIGFFIPDLTSQVGQSSSVTEQVATQKASQGTDPTPTPQAIQPASNLITAGNTALPISVQNNLPTTQAQDNDESLTTSSSSSARSGVKIATAVG